MSDGKSKILVLVEGAKTDVKLMQKLFEVYGISERYEILSYNTNIYTLYREMFSDGDPSSIDTLQNLRNTSVMQRRKSYLTTGTPTSS